MKPLLFLVFFLLSLKCAAFRGFNLNDFSLLVGQQWKKQQTILWSIDFQYENYRKTCTQTKNYIGFGLNHSFRNTESTFGVKLLWNPTKFKLALNRNSALIPYLIGQLDYSKQTLKSTSVFRTGLGLTGTFCFTQLPNFKASLQATYAIPLQTYQTMYSGVIIECKVGLGINQRIYCLFRRNTENGVECDENE